MPVALLLACLPYLAIRCVGAPGGCEVVSKGAHADSGSEGHGHHDHEAAAGHRHDQGSPSDRDRSCCELTGKCDIKITASAPAIDPPALVATLPLVVPVSDRWTTVLIIPPAELAHGPPLYLRHATLLI